MDHSIAKVQRNSKTIGNFYFDESKTFLYNVPDLSTFEVRSRITPS